MAEIDKTLNQAPEGGIEDLALEEAQVPLDVEVEEEGQETLSLGPSPEDDRRWIR
jgi:hypothetical protein